MHTDMETLTTIHEIGDIMAKSIINFFHEKNNQKVIKACLNSGVYFSKVKKITKSIYTGKIFVFTGSLEEFSRNDAKEMVEKIGARASGSVSNKTDFLVAGPGAGSKLDKAKELDIPILSELKFLEMMKKNG